MIILRDWMKDDIDNIMSDMRDRTERVKKARCHVSMNEVYDRLGIPGTVHWLEYAGVNFGIMDECSLDFVSGYENVVILDFNVDDNILN